MVDIKFKVLPAGEGKTRWLVNQAFNECSKGNSVYLLTDNDEEYQKFMLRYRTEYSMYCPVKMVANSDEIKDGVILIDNFVEKIEKGILNVSTIQSVASDVFATISGRAII
jgi:hypothetical protein